jgi:hypothetical protein
MLAFRVAVFVFSLWFYLMCGVPSFAQNQVPMLSARDTLIVEAEGIGRVMLHRKEFAALPRKQVKAKDYKSQNIVTFEGVELHAVLQKAGVKLGKDLKHTELSKYLLAEGHDGYKVIFALAEIEPLFTDNIILLADTKDGKPLDDYAGAMCLIIPHEKKNGRWMRQLKSLSIKKG